MARGLWQVQVRPVPAQAWLSRKAQTVGGGGLLFHLQLPEGQHSVTPVCQEIRFGAGQGWSKKPALPPNCATLGQLLNFFGS